MNNQASFSFSLCDRCASSESRPPLAHILIAAPVYRLRVAASSYVEPGNNKNTMSTL